MRRPNNSMFNANKLKLGIFSPNCSGGMAVTRVPERWDASWEHNRALAVMADAAGIEFLLPIARWIGYGGETEFQNNTLETITWATGLLASTQRISVFATAHTAFTHPIVAAKQFATMDQIGSGRFGLNVVCGWNKPEYDMFGIPLPTEHTARYGFGQEWYDVVRKIWSSAAPFDWDGKYFHLKHVFGDPKPVGGVLPPIMNAGSSAEGRDFAARNADFLFTVLIDPEQGRNDVCRYSHACQDALRPRHRCFHDDLCGVPSDRQGGAGVSRILCRQGGGLARRGPVDGAARPSRKVVSAGSIQALPQPFRRRARCLSVGRRPRPGRR